LRNRKRAKRRSGGLRPGTPVTSITEDGMNVNEYAETLVKDFIRNITDHVFMSIQSDEGLYPSIQKVSVKVMALYAFLIVKK